MEDLLISYGPVGMTILVIGTVLIWHLRACSSRYDDLYKLVRQMSVDIAYLKGKYSSKGGSDK